jgi:hypothetical protein
MNLHPPIQFNILIRVYLQESPNTHATALFHDPDMSYHNRPLYYVVSVSYEFLKLQGAQCETNCVCANWHD